MRKNPLAGIELTSQRVRGLRSTSELPGRPIIGCIQRENGNDTKVLGKFDISKDTEKNEFFKNEKRKDADSNCWVTACGCRGACIYGHTSSKSMDQPGVRLPFLHVVS